MKISLFLLLLSLVHVAHAQVLGTPISITEEGDSQKPGEDPEVARARSELEASKIKPSAKDPNGDKVDQTPDDLNVAEDQSPDGTISGDKIQPVATPAPTPAAAVVEKPEVEAEAPAAAVVEEEVKSEAATTEVEKSEVQVAPARVNWKKLSFFKAPRWFRLSGGRLWSSWSKISPELEDGSRIIGFRVVQPVETTRYSMGFGLDVVHGSGDSFNAESVRSTHVVLENEYDHAMGEKLSLVYGLSFEYADSNIRKVIANNDQNVTYQKFAAGSTFGLVPAVSVRLKATDNFLIDLTPGYAFYFASPYDEMGGLSLRLRLNFAL